MTLRRFYAPPESFASDGSAVALGADEARHLREVLRLSSGDEALVFDGEGREFRCVVEVSRRDRATLSVVEEVPPSRPESPLHLTLALALLKGEKFDLAVQKAAELGAARVVPVLTKLADVRLRDVRDASRRVERYRRIAVEACKQSGRARVPRVDAPCDLDTLLKAEPSESGALWRVMFSERGGAGLREAAGNLDFRPVSVAALVGPEGGWTDEEIGAAIDYGWCVVTLGGRTLRAETAAITVTALLQYLFGDLV